MVIGMATMASAAAPKVNKEPGAIGFGGQVFDAIDAQPGDTKEVVLVPGSFDVDFDKSTVPAKYGKYMGYTHATNGFVFWEDMSDKDFNDFVKIMESNATTASKGTMLMASLGMTYADAEAPWGYQKKDLPKVVARTKISKGSNVIKTADLVFDPTARVKIEFVNPFKSNNPDGQAFDIWVYPVVDGKSWDHEKYGVNFNGTLKNETVNVDAATNYVDLYNGYIAKMDANVRNVKFDLGSDIVVIAKAHKGAKYWGKANQDVSETDIENMDKYDINAVYHLDVLGGLDKGTSNVEIAGLTKSDYIFDGSLKFLGTGDSKTIPFAETYYVADKMIEVASEEEPVENTDEETDPLALAPQTGGDISAPAGLFDNPSTGA
jgi:hypothetical protein